ncbi:unnamed protein product [Arctogadus glacialis]
MAPPSISAPRVLLRVPESPGGPRPGLGDRGPVWGTAARSGGPRPGLEDRGPVWRTAARSGGPRPGLGDRGPVWGTTARSGGASDLVSADGLSAPVPQPRYRAPTPPDRTPPS